MAQKDQVAITLSPQEREIVEKIAVDLGRSVASVLRECAMDGLPNVIQKYSAMKQMMVKETS
ncbi:MAG TPA: hypothetical protein DCL61_05020 [Cyanobacteria bacterium UBA12227]|nr:hypothetical protein [Cyanobacteria bacterium UBA12227]HAX84757.1 hypothetical protein [Cyanobacteria bacterium UBA11370]HBY81565.1 hypothetical protein [Cyanobacteria bacterium UBA11148]